MSRTIYPRFLGVDGSGDFVWELENGRWTWGDDPHAAFERERSFEPIEYIEKYGRPVGLGEIVDRKTEADMDPAQFLKDYVAPPEIMPLPVQTRRVLTVMRNVVAGWVEGAKENHAALGHRGEGTGQECWNQFHPEDIHRMIDDVAGQLGLPENWRF
jgi:hypothetical protein